MNLESQKSVKLASIKKGAQIYGKYITEWRFIIIVTWSITDGKVEIQCQALQLFCPPWIVILKQTPSQTLVQRNCLALPATIKNYMHYQ